MSGRPKSPKSPKIPATPRSRPGGRSRRVREAVFAAVEELLLQKPGDLPSMADIAERACVNQTSLYRRWGDVRKLAGEVAVERLMRTHPVPDTGSVRGDLIGWAYSVAKTLGARQNVMLLRVFTSVPPSRTDTLEELRDRPIGPRITEIEAVLARGAARGELVPSLDDVLELVLAPVYLHALFLGPILHPEAVEHLVDRALWLARESRPQLQR